MADEEERFFFYSIPARDFGTAHALPRERCVVLMEIKAARGWGVGRGAGSGFGDVSVCGGGGVGGALVQFLPV